MSLGLVHELTAELSLATSGVGFIARCLDRLVERLELTDAIAVLHDPVLGPQIFTAGRRPLPVDTVPSLLLDRGAGIHTEPTTLDHAADLEAIRHLCEVAFRLDRLQHESLHDPLTGLHNRRGFDAQLVQAVSRAQRHRLTFAHVLLDLDGFKSINDRLGHQRGDAVLRGVGERLRLGLRAGDVAARVGGDEFALIVHVGDEPELLPVLDRLGERSVLRDEVDDVGWTVGISICPDDGATAEELYRIADKRLYEAKSLRKGANDGRSP
ncbi:MAG: GGDEF domain-containing protein [Actinomycetota bacterium]|nr:GGDEF domain-containing protein [Acidimicrobiia bacterium]MDQ3294851.1 GGDEF domain-containing protein [Actinomycetota bacterium]